MLDDGHALHAVVSVQPFALDQAFVYTWSAGHPSVDHGLLVVLDVDPGWLIPSDTHQAVLYADAIPVERLNTGFPSGRVAVVVPNLGALDKTILYFGGYELPERVDAGFGAQVLGMARATGIVALAVPPMGPTLHLADEGALMRAGWGLRGITRP